MFLPNTTGFLSTVGGTNLFSEAVFSDPIEVECAVVHLNKVVEKTSVRTDSSASRGNAEEAVSMAKILFPNTVQIVAGDKFQIAGFTLRVQGIEPRNDVLGNLDHYEVDFTSWQR